MAQPGADADPTALDDAAILRRLGTRVRELRLERGLSQEAVAERGGITYKHFGEIERSDTNPSATSLVAIARGLGVTVGELFETITPERQLPMPRRTIGVVRESIRSLTAMLEELGGTLDASPPSEKPYKIPRGRSPRRRKNT